MRTPRRSVTALAASLVAGLAASLVATTAVAQAAPKTLRLNLGAGPNDRSGSPVRTLFQELEDGLNGVVGSIGQPNGVVPLDLNGLIPPRFIPGTVSLTTIVPQAFQVHDVDSGTPTSSYASLTVQNTPVTAAAILAPQQPPGWFTVDGIRSVIVVPSNAKATTTSAFGFYVRNEAPERATGATGLYGTTVCVVDDSACWGLNPTVIDAPTNGTITNGRGRKLIGAEFDISVTSPNTVVSGVNVTGSSIAQPAGADAFQVGDLWASNPGVNKWTHGLTIGAATSQIGVLHGAQALGGALIGSIPDFWDYRDAAGVVHSVVVQGTGLGGLNVSGTALPNGLTLSPGARGAPAMLSAFGGDANVDLGLKGQGAGAVVTTSRLAANGGLYATGSVVFAVPVQKRVYQTANLPPCNAALMGGDAFVSDAASPVSGEALAGGGTTFRPVYCRGDGWYVY